MNHNELQSVSLVSDEYGQFSAWDLKHQPFFIGQRFHKLSTLGNVEKEKLGDEICKTNQQYRLFVNYNFIGAPKLAEDFQKENVDAINKVMPLGFKAKTNEIEGMGEMPANKSYLLILLVIGIIYFVCTILLESFRQPFAIILAIPVAYIGVFLTFYLFELNFDQGGFASFILLSGIVVNAGLYIINQYNRLCRERNESGSIRLYLKAWNDKIIPICLTILSTVLGLVPFLWNGQKEVFWFAFAVGSIGGLFFSLIAVFFYLPLFLKFKHPDSKK
jgi:multidrug efflux pump subunit AcrB